MTCSLLHLYCHSACCLFERFDMAKCAESLSVKKCIRSEHRESSFGKLAGLRRCCLKVGR